MALNDPLPKDGLLTLSLVRQMIKALRLAGPHGIVILELGSDGKIMRIKYTVSQKAEYI